MILIVVVALIGLLASIAAHIATFFPPSPLLDAAWVLDVALCGVWLPLLVAGTLRIFDIVNVDQKWTLIPRHAPEWSKRLAVVLLAYAIFNFLFTMIVLNEGGFPAVVDGRAVLHTYNFGVVIRELTPAEYQLHQAYVVRASSGHWMLLYYLAAMGAHSHVVARRLARQAARASAPRAAGLDRTPVFTTEQAE